MNINWTRTEMVMTNLPKKDLHKLIRFARRELNERWQEAEALKKRLAGSFVAMSNFLAGVTWALSCRQALRASKGHEPLGGTRPQSGEMWLPFELLYAVRHQVKQRGWHPCTASSWDVVRGNLEAEHRAVTCARTDDDIRAVKFVIPFVRQEARMEITRRSMEERFDLGGGDA